MSYGGSRGMIFAATTRGCANSLVPAALGIAVSTLAFAAHRILCKQVNALTFDMELERTRLADLLRNLLRRAGHRERFLTAARLCPSRTLITDNTVILVRPGMFRHGVLELLWPRIQTLEDFEVFLSQTRMLLLAYSALAWFSSVFYGLRVAGLQAAYYFAVAAAIVHRWPRAAVLFGRVLVCPAIIHVLSSETEAACWLLAIALPLLSTVVAVFRYTRRKIDDRTELRFH